MRGCDARKRIKVPERRCRGYRAHRPASAVPSFCSTAPYGSSSTHLNGHATSVAWYCRPTHLSVIRWRTSGTCVAQRRKRCRRGRRIIGVRRFGPAWPHQLCQRIMVTHAFRDTPHGNPLRVFGNDESSGTRYVGSNRGELRGDSEADGHVYTVCRSGDGQTRPTRPVGSGAS